MKLSRQTLLGAVLFLGGGVMLYAMVQQLDTSNPLKNSQPTPQVAALQSDEPDDTSNRPLTADIETEQRILAQKQQQRAERVAEQERRAQEFLAEQERAQTLALNKSRLENEQYRANNAIEPVPSNEDIPDNDTTATSNSTATQSNAVPVTPVVQPRQAPIVAPREPTNATTSPPNNSSTSASSSVSANGGSYQVQRGDGLIKLAREYNVPIEVLAKANNMSTNTQLRLGQTLTIPSRQQVQRLQRELQTTAVNKPVANTSEDTNTRQNDAAKAQSNSAPSRPIDYSVQSGDGLIKLARQYNVPVEALAQANNLSKSASLHVGQKLTIPSQAQVTRLQREAQQRAQAAQDAKDAEQRLAQARQAAAQGEVQGTFGVQVALADNQAKADEVAKRMRAAGYKVSTSQTSRGVRVIVGPEAGKPAALALKDKINADPNVNVNGAWVLYWR